MDELLQANPAFTQSTKQTLDNAQPVLTALIEKVSSPAEVENLLQRFAQQAYNRYGAAVCKHPAVRDLLADGMLASIDPSRAVRLPSEVGELAESGSEGTVVKTELFTNDHVSPPAEHQRAGVRQNVDHDHGFTYPASEPATSLHIDSQWPPTAEVHPHSDNAGPVFAHHGLPSVHDSPRHPEIPQFGQVSHLNFHYFDSLGDRLGDRREGARYQTNPAELATNVDCTAQRKTASTDSRHDEHIASISVTNGQERKEHAFCAGDTYGVVQPAQTTKATQVSATAISSALANVNPARANLMTSHLADEFVPWFKDNEYQHFQPTGANTMALNDNPEAKPDIRQNLMTRNGQPSGLMSLSDYGAGKQAVKSGKTRRGRKRKHAADEDETLPLSNMEPSEDKTVVLALLDPSSQFDKPSHYQRIVKTVCAKLNERIRSYYTLDAVPGVSLPPLSLEGCLPNGSCISFDTRDRQRSAHSIEVYLASILRSPQFKTTKQKRTEIDKLLRHVVRWNPGLFPELTSTMADKRIRLQVAFPACVQTALQVLASAEGLKLSKPLRATDGYSIAAQIFQATKACVTKRSPESALLHDATAQTLFSGAGYNTSALAFRPVAAKFSLVEGDVGTPRRNFKTTLEACFTIQTNKSEDFEAELERALYALADQDKTAWPELFA